MLVTLYMVSSSHIRLTIRLKKTREQVERDVECKNMIYLLFAQTMILGIP